MKVLKKPTAQDRRKWAISQDLAHHKKAIAPMVFREQRQALNYPKRSYHINPVQEYIKKRQHQLHPDYRHLARIGLY